MLSKLLCRLGNHDWRNMDGVCTKCGWIDPLWHAPGCRCSIWRGLDATTSIRECPVHGDRELSSD